MAYLTTRTQASSVACNDILHIVKTTDTSQNPAGSSYKATVGQLLSGCCINDFYVKNIHGCNTGNLFVQPLDEGNIYFGSNTAADGFTIDLNTETANRARIGLNNTTPDYSMEFNSWDDKTHLIWYDKTTTSGFEAYRGFLHMGDSDTIVYVGAAVTPFAGIQCGQRGFSQTTGNGSQLGDPGDSFIFSSDRSKGLNIISSPSIFEPLNPQPDYIRFFAGNDPDFNNVQATMFMCGRDGYPAGSSKGNICINCNNPTESLDVNGNLRIRTVPSASYSLSLGIAATGELRYQNTSDIRLKKDISTIESALTKVLNLRGVNFTWIDNEEVGTQIGFIAQEVEQVVPELTFEVPNPNEDYKGVHYENVSALLVEAVKELNEKTKLKEYTPTSISDPYGEKGDQVFDDNFMYIKTGAGWKKFPLMDV